MSGRTSLARVSLDRNDQVQLTPGDGALALGAYSRFKHGDALVAHEYGTRLAHLAADVLAGHRPAPVVVTSSGYHIAPTAANSLLAPFVATLTSLTGLDVTTTKTDRTRPSPRDYAAMNELERRRAIEGTLTASAADVAGAHVLAIDDVRVTGLHEDAMNAALERAGVGHVDHLYVLDASALRHRPDIEARLNRAQVTSVTDLAALVVEPSFTPNTRVARMVLSAPNDLLDRFIETAPADVLDWFMGLALRDRLAGTPDCRGGAERLAAHPRLALAAAG